MRSLHMTGGALESRTHQNEFFPKRCPFGNRHETTPRLSVSQTPVRRQRSEGQRPRPRNDGWKRENAAGISVYADDATPLRKS